MRIEFVELLILGHPDLVTYVIGQVTKLIWSHSHVTNERTKQDLDLTLLPHALLLLHQDSQNLKWFPEDHQ
jgi:hypothetical protein